MATAEKGIKFFMGQPRPSEALLGYLESGSASIRDGKTPEPCNAIGGKLIIPNRSIVWGIRLMRDGSAPKNFDKLQPNDKQYNGKVKFVRWGTEGGMPITIRHKSGTDSIDYDYQILQLGMKPFEHDQEVENNYLEFNFGENVIFDSEESKQLFISNTHLNTDSISKNPDVIDGYIRLVKPFESSKEQVKSIDAEFEAVKVVRAAKTFAEIELIREIIAGKVEIVSDRSDENSLYEHILLWAKQNAKLFLECIAMYDGRVSDVIEKFRSYKAFDLTTPGTIRGGLDKKEIILTGIDAKGEDMASYLFENRMKAEVHEAINKMIYIAQNFK